MNTLKFKLKNQQVYRSSELILNKLTRSRIILPVLVLLTCLIISYISWDIADRNRKNELRSYFEYRARDVNDRIKNRIVEYQTILRSTRGLFNASENVNRAEFRDFINSLSLEINYPGIQGVGFSLIIPSEQIKKHITTIRNEGFTEYKIWPEGNRETYTSIIYLEPFRDLNLRAFGYDMYSEPVRRKAMTTSRDLNKTVISTKVNLVQETGKDVQAGFLMYLPVYRYGTLNTTLTERRTNIVGWVYAPFRMGDFMEGVLGERAADLDIEIYDGKNILDETKMYGSITLPPGIHQPLVIKKVIEINEHAWTVLVNYTPKLESRIGYNTAVMILIIGISLSILLSIITWLLVNKRMRTILADTERKQMESALKTSEERFRTAAGNLTDVVYDWDINHKLDWYGDIDGITGYSPGGFPRTIEGWEALIHPEDKNRIVTALENHIKGTAPYSTEYRIKRSDGMWQWWAARGTALRDDHGKPYKMIGSITDITEQKEFQNRIKFKSELLSHIGQAVVATDLQGNVIYWNKGAEEIYGWSPAEAMGKSIVALTPTEHAKEYASEIMKALSEGKSWSGEFLVKRKDGSSFSAYVTDTPILDSDGKLIGVIGISSDITERKQAAEALQESEERYRQVIQNASDIIFTTDLKGNILFGNNAALNISGYSFEEFTKLNYLNLALPEFRRKIQFFYLRQFKNKIPTSHLDFPLKNKFGDTIWLGLNSNLIFENDKIIGFHILGRDITERKKAAEALSNERTLLRTIIDLIPDAIYAVDIEGRKILANAKEIELSGKNSEDEIIGKTDFDLYSEIEAQRYYEEDQIIIKSGKPALYIEDTLKGKDGQIHWLLGSKVPLRDVHGKIIGIVGVNHDITERKNAEEALRESHQIIEGIINTIPVRVFWKDKNLIYLGCNNLFAQDAGFTNPNDIIGKNDFQMGWHSQAELYRADDQKVIESSAARLHVEEPQTTPEGNTITLLTSKIPLVNHTKETIGILGTYIDISERKRAEEEIKKSHEELVKLNAEKDKFFSIIAHDLKSPFNGLVNLTALMADTSENFSLDEFIEYSKMLNKAAGNIYTLLDNLLEWSQIQKGSISFNPKISNLSSMVSQSIETIYQDALNKRITIINEINNPQNVYADEKSISTVLRNLLSNAVKFTKTGGKIVIKSKRINESTIQVSVQDNGVGIYDDDIKNLFRIEEKVSTRGTEGEPSTGLGLLLCKEFVEMHGQKIWAESEINKGSIFSFTLRAEK